MKDPRMDTMMNPKKKPIFNHKRMMFGGFEVMVDA